MKLILIICIISVSIFADTFVKSKGFKTFSNKEETITDKTVAENQAQINDAVKKNKADSELKFGDARLCEYNAKTSEEKRRCWTKYNNIETKALSYSEMEESMKGTEKIQSNLNISGSIDNVDLSKFNQKLNNQDMEKIKRGLY
jgi:hypothetical protein